MTRTMTVDLGNELPHYVLRLLREKHAGSELQQLRRLIDEGEASGSPITWNAHEFLGQMKKIIHAK